MPQRLKGILIIYQVAGIVQTLHQPLPTALLKKIQTRWLLADAPDLVEVKPKKGTDQNLIDDLMADEDKPFSRMAGSHLADKRLDAGLDIGKAFTLWKPNLARSHAPSSIELRVEISCFGVGQALETAIVDVQQARVGLDRQS